MDSNKSHGILMSEEDIIFSHVDTFCNRIKCVIDQMVSLSQFISLYKTSSGLSRPKREDLRPSDTNDKNYEEFSDEEDELEGGNSEFMSNENLNEYADLFTSNKAILEILVEENEESSTQSMYKDQRLKGSAHNKKADEDNTSNLDSHLIDNDDKQDDTRPLSSNTKMTKLTEKLFNTEQNVDTDTTNILKRAQTLSKEDLKLMSMRPRFVLFLFF